MRKKNHGFIAFLILACLLLAWLLLSSNRTIQSSRAVLRPLEFVGEYSRDDGAWRPLDADADLNALHGSLRLRGYFPKELSGTILHFYLDHLYMEVTVNDEVVYTDMPPLELDIDIPCGSKWVEWSVDSLTPDDEVEIHLVNPHQSGNPRAYHEFLKQIYPGQRDVFQNFIRKPSESLSMNVAVNGKQAVWDFLLSGQLWRGAGSLIMVISVLLLGIALSDTLENKLFGLQLWLIAGVAMFGGGMIYMDTPDISLVSQLDDFNSNAALICQMLMMLGICMYAALNTAGRLRTLSLSGIALLFFVDVGIALAGILNLTTACKAYGVWNIAQGLICLLLMGIYGVRLRHRKEMNLRQELPAAALLAAAVLEHTNTWLGFWQRGLVLRSVFLMVFAVCLIYAVGFIPHTFQAKKQADQLEKELAEDRINIMLSQIQPHFLYNALVSIAQLCEKDPAQAKQATITFSDYLRGNMNTLKEKKPVPFAQELEHLKSYTELEKMRFGDLLNVAWDIQATQFSIPVLTVQPLVENAIKHGVGMKEDGGTVRIATKEYPDHFEVIVSDDGVGFGPESKMSDGRSHIGIENVRHRLLMQSHATLVIESAPGIGTVATIILPKEEETV